jgi:hypothetical protein
LSIVKAIVLRHAGRVSATSTVGRGTTIRIELPAKPSPDTVAASQHEPTQSDTPQMDIGPLPPA